MQWTRTDTLSIADHRCVLCFGLGLRGGRLEATQPCNCVLRAVFRSCYERFMHYTAKDKFLTQTSFTDTGKRTRGRIWGRKEEEFMADFVLVAKRTLKRNPIHAAIFRFHYLLGADWHLCMRRLGISKGDFFHDCYRVEQKLGRVFVELKPYPLYPVDEYFNGVTLDHKQVRRQKKAAAK